MFFEFDFSPVAADIKQNFSKDTLLASAIYLIWEPGIEDGLIQVKFHNADLFAKRLCDPSVRQIALRHLTDHTFVLLDKFVSLVRWYLYDCNTSYSVAFMDGNGNFTGR